MNPLVPELAMSSVFQALLLDIHVLLATAEPRLGALMQTLCEKLADSLGHPLVWAGALDASGELEIVGAAGAAGEAMLGARLRHVAGPRGEPLAMRCLREGRPAFAERAVAELPARLATPAGPMLALPMRFGAATLGVLALHAGENRGIEASERTMLELVAGHAGCAMNVALRGAEEKIAAERLKLAAAVFEHAREGIFVTDARQRIRAVNPAMCRIYGYSEAELLGATPALFRSGVHDDGFYADFWRDLEEKAGWHGEVWNRRKDGEVFPELLSVSAIRDEAGTVSEYVAVLMDISTQKDLEAALNRKAHHDELTGLANRAYFKDYMSRSLAHARREQHGLAVLFLDIDHFKYVNDTLGHHEGDALLKAVGERLERCVRSEDMVARFGGDEFAVLLAAIHHMQDAAAVARKILAQLAEPLQLGGREINATASIGIAVFPEDGGSIETLLRRADNAMYGAKEMGRNGVQFYRPEMDARSRERLAIGSDLRHALERDEFFLVYQPQIDLVDDHVVGVEALLRWRHGEEIIAPQRFIHIAEESGLIVPIGERVLRMACEQALAWRRAGLGEPRMAVNLSARQFRERGLLAMVRAVLEETGYSGLDLELEITESLAMTSVAETTRTIAALKEMGVGVAIDDFGTGYSSLAYLGQYPLDTLKIDHSFVRGIGCDERIEAIVLAVIAIARTLSLDLVAEGVETAAQLEFLRRHGCRVAQGYFLGKPMPAQEFARWYAARAASPTRR